MSDSYESWEPCKCCETQWGKCDDPDLGKVCVSCWSYLFWAGRELRAQHDRETSTKE